MKSEKTGTYSLLFPFFTYYIIFFTFYILLFTFYFFLPVFDKQQDAFFHGDFRNLAGEGFVADRTLIF